MNIRDLQPGSYQPVGQKMNINSLQPGSYQQAGQQNDLYSQITNEKDPTKKQAALETVAEHGQSLLDTLSSGVQSLYNTYKNLPGMKQAGQLVGGAVQTIGSGVGGIVGGALETGKQAINTVEGKGFDAGQIGKTARQTAKETAQFGKEIGQEAPAAASLGAFGKGVNLALGASQAYEGYKMGEEGIQTGNAEEAIKGGITAALGAYGLKHSAGGIFSDIKSGVENGAKAAAESGKSPLMSEIGGAVKNLKKDLIFSPEFKDFVSSTKGTIASKISGRPASILSERDVKQLQSALKPTVAQRKSFASDAKLTLDYLKDQKIESTGNPIVDLHNAIVSGYKNIWDGVKSSVAQGKEDGLQIDMSEAAQQIRDLADSNKKLQIEDSPLLKQLESKAKSYEGVKMDPVEAQDMLSQLNAEANAYYKKNFSDRSAAERSDPMFAADLKLADIIKKQLNEKIAVADDGGFAGLKKLYAAMSNMSEVTRRRIEAVANQDNTSLPQKLSAGRAAAVAGVGAVAAGPAGALAGVADYGLTTLIKHLEEPNTKIAGILAKIQKTPSAGVLPGTISNVDFLKLLLRKGIPGQAAMQMNQPNQQ